MNTENNGTEYFDIDNLDMVEIEKRARQLRAEALQGWVKSLKASLSGFGFGTRGRAANV